MSDQGAEGRPTPCTPGHCDRCIPDASGQHVDIHSYGQRPCAHVTNAETFRRVHDVAEGLSASVNVLTELFRGAIVELAQVTDELAELRTQRDAALDLASDMHDLIHTASHTPNGTWGTVAEFIAARLRRALGVTDA